MHTACSSARSEVTQGVLATIIPLDLLSIECLHSAPPNNCNLLPMPLNTVTL